MRLSRVIRAAAGVSILAAAPVLAVPKTVRVDCAKGKTVRDNHTLDAGGSDFDCDGNETKTSTSCGLCP